MEMQKLLQRIYNKNKEKMKKIIKWQYIIIAILLIFFITSLAVNMFFAKEVKQLVEERVILPTNTKVYSASMFKFHDRYIQQKALTIFIEISNPKLDSYEIEKMSVDIMDAALIFNIHPYKIASLIKIESTFNKDAKSIAQCIGLMQLNHRIHLKNFISNFKDINSLNDLKKSRQNIMAGTWLFKMMIEASGGNINGALTRYLGCSSLSYRLKFYENLDILKDIEDSIRQEWKFPR